MKLLKAVFCLQVLLCLADSYNAREKRETLIDAGTHIKVCRQDPVELAIVFDTSASISRPGFRKAKCFLMLFIEGLELGSGNEGVRVAVIPYAYGIYTDLGFNLTTYNTKERMLYAVYNISQNGQRTDTGDAIRHMKNVLLHQDIVRPNALRIAVVITDGNSQKTLITKTAAQEARDGGILMYVVGVGQNVDNVELKNIAGQDSRVVRVNSYHDLSPDMLPIINKNCTLRPKNNETQAFKTQGCGDLNPTEINFIFNPASLGHLATNWATSFIRHTIKAQDSVDGFKYQLTSGSCPDNLKFDSTYCDTAEECMERLEAYDVNPLNELLDRLVSDGDPSRRQHTKPQFSQVAVIVVSGDKKEAKGLEANIKEMISNNIKVYIADPTGNGVEVEGAMTLTGESPTFQSEMFITLLCPSTATDQ